MNRPEGERLTTEETKERATQVTVDQGRLRSFCCELTTRARPLQIALLKNEDLDEELISISEFFARIAESMNENCLHAKHFTRQDLYARLYLFLNYCKTNTKELREAGIDLNARSIGELMSFFDDDDNREPLVDSLYYGLVDGFKPLKRLDGIHDYNEWQEKYKNHKSGNPFSDAAKLFGSQMIDEIEKKAIQAVEGALSKAAL